MKTATLSSILFLLCVSQGYVQAQETEVRYVVPAKYVGKLQQENWKDAQELSATLDDVRVLRVLSSGDAFNAKDLRNKTQIFKTSFESTLDRLLGSNPPLISVDGGKYQATETGLEKGQRPCRILASKGTYIRDAFDEVANNLQEDFADRPAFSFPENVTLIGGFDVAGVDANKTVISGIMSFVENEQGRMRFADWKYRFKTVVEIASKNVVISKVSIQEGNSTSDDDAPAVQYLNGAGVFVQEAGAVVLRNCEIANNYAEERGGGVYNAGFVRALNCTIAGNQAEEEGGGIFTVKADDASVVTVLNNTIISNNFAPNSPGASDLAGKPISEASTNCMFGSAPIYEEAIPKQNLLAGPGMKQLSAGFLRAPNPPESNKSGSVNDLRLQRSSLNVNRGLMRRTGVDQVISLNPSFLVLGDSLNEFRANQVKVTEPINSWNDPYSGIGSSVPEFAMPNVASSPLLTSADSISFTKPKNHCLKLDKQIISQQSYTIVAIAKTGNWGVGKKTLLSNWQESTPPAENDNKLTSVFLGVESSKDATDAIKHVVRVNDEYSFSIPQSTDDRFRLTVTRSPDEANAWMNSKPLPRADDGASPKADRVLTTDWYLGRQGNMPSAAENWDGEIFDIVVFDRVLGEKELKIVWQFLDSNLETKDLANANRLADQKSKGRLDIGCYEYPFDSEERFFAIRPDLSDQNKVNFRRPSDNDWRSGPVTLSEALIAAKELNGPPNDAEDAYANDISEIRLVSGDYQLNEEFEIPSNIAIRGGFNQEDEAELLKGVEKRTGLESKISGGGENRLFKINNALDISLDHLFLKKGNILPPVEEAESTSAEELPANSTSTDTPAPETTAPATPPEPVINRNGGAILITQDDNALTTKGIDLNYLAIHSCKAEQGGAIWTEASDATMRNCTIVGNSASGLGSGVCVASGNLVAHRNVILLNNGKYQEKGTATDAAPNPPPIAREWGAANVAGKLANGSFQNVLVHEELVVDPTHNLAQASEEKPPRYNYLISSKHTDGSLGYSLKLRAGKWLHGTTHARDLNPNQYGIDNTKDDLTPTRIAPFRQLIETREGDLGDDERRDLRGNVVVKTDSKTIDVGAYQYIQPDNGVNATQKASNSPSNLALQIERVKRLNSDDNSANDILVVEVTSRPLSEMPKPIFHTQSVDSSLGELASEIALGDETKVEDILDCPAGVSFNDGKLTGAPTKAGEFVSTIIYVTDGFVTERKINWKVTDSATEDSATEDSATEDSATEDSAIEAPAEAESQPIELPGFLTIQGVSQNSEGKKKRVELEVPMSSELKSVFSAKNAQRITLAGLAFVNNGNADATCLRIEETTNAGWRSQVNVSDCAFGNWTNRAINCQGESGVKRELLRIERTEFANNNSVAKESGGAVQVHLAHAIIRDCFFYGNLSDGDGGAIWLGNGSLRIEDSTFASNTANKGTAVFVNESGSSLTVDKSTFVYNEPHFAGSGSAVFLNADGKDSAIEKVGGITNNIFSNAFQWRDAQADQVERRSGDIDIRTPDSDATDYATERTQADGPTLLVHLRNSNVLGELRIGNKASNRLESAKELLIARDSDARKDRSLHRNNPSFLATPKYYKAGAPVKTMPILSSDVRSRMVGKGAFEAKEIIPFVHGVLENDGTTLTGVVVSLKRTGMQTRTTLTDSKGRFIFRQVPVGSEITADNFEPVRVSTMGVDLPLSPEREPES